MNDDDVHDFAGLLDRTSGRDRWLALGGPSGSGKSTLTRWLLAAHPGWQGPSFVVAHLPGSPVDLTPAEQLTEPRVVLIDEIVTVPELVRAARLLRAGHRLLLCTHLPGPCFAPLRLLARGRFVSTTVAGPAKIERALRRRGLRFSERGVRTYLRRFGAVYPEIEMVLERCPSDDFDVAMRRFDKYHRIQTSPA